MLVSMRIGRHAKFDPGHASCAFRKKGFSFSPKIMLRLFPDARFFDTSVCRLEVFVSNRYAIQSGSEPLPGYRLTNVIGKGGFAEVWEAVHGGEKVALKFISSGTTTTTVKEIKSLSAIQKLSHPGLIQMDKVSSIPGYIVISMELAEGSLLDLLDAFQTEFQTPIELKLLLDYMQQAADAIDYMNQRQHSLDGRTVGFQHCDIKPSNLLLFGDRVKLADFGLSTPTYTSRNPILRMGTLDFAAPEFHMGILTDRSDQYSLAITYYYLRTSRFPFPPPPKNKFESSYAYNRPYPDLSQVPGQEQAILMRALDLAPDSRWPTCNEMIKRIREIHGFSTSFLTSRSSCGANSAVMKAQPGSVTVSSNSGVMSRKSVVAAG